jgi:hypothetical protein
VLRAVPVFKARVRPASITLAFIAVEVNGTKKLKDGCDSSIASPPNLAPKVNKQNFRC